MGQSGPIVQTEEASVNRNSIRLRKVLVAALAVPILLAGCTTMQTGREFNYAKFSQETRPGTTDMAQVRAVLGPPMGKGLVVEADGSLYEQWTYYYGTGNLTNPEKSRFKLLQIRFNQAGTVASYNWSGELSGGATEGK
jgi:outer membrane protein assembly factor BamE (lipoprotein component of BamABCDE complex)